MDSDRRSFASDEEPWAHRVIILALCTTHTVTDQVYGSDRLLILTLFQLLSKPEASAQVPAFITASPAQLRTWYPPNPATTHPSIQTSKTCINLNQNVQVGAEAVSTLFYKPNSSRKVDTKFYKTGRCRRHERAHLRPLGHPQCLRAGQDDPLHRAEKRRHEVARNEHYECRDLQLLPHVGQRPCSARSGHL